MSLYLKVYYNVCNYLDDRYQFLHILHQVLPGSAKFTTKCVRKQHQRPWNGSTTHVSKCDVYGVKVE